jgi:hypothetical protein
MEPQLLLKGSIMVKLHTIKPDDSIHVSQMKDGEIAVIVSWSYPEPVGQIVQRYDECLVALGGTWGKGWSMAFEDDGIKNTKCRVKILPPGTLLEV